MKQVMLEECRMKRLLRSLIRENKDPQKAVCSKGTGTSFSKCDNQNLWPI